MNFKTMSEASNSVCEWPSINPTELSEKTHQLFKGFLTIKKPETLSVDELIKNSTEFPVKFPIQTCRIISQPNTRHRIIQDQAAGAYPVVHERVLWLYSQFLLYKQKYGNKIEKRVYSHMTLPQLIDRLLTKRCISFLGRGDRYLLLSGEKGFSGFIEIGTEKEKYPLILENCLSYEEIKLSALLSVSSHSEFINNGNRKNKGIVEMDKTKIEREGVIIGIIGARFERKRFMEFEDIVIAQSQNTLENGYNYQLNENQQLNEKQAYRKMWDDFYLNQSQLFTAVRKDGKRYVDSKKKEDIFDNEVMRKRYQISFDTLLLEAESRAAKANKKAYIHVVGIGLGVWRANKGQEAVFLEAFEQRILSLIPNLQHVSWIHFSWFNLSQWGQLKNGNVLRCKEHKNDIRIFISKRDPAEKLIGIEYENALVIESYAWDGNALPGNEFWIGWLKSTGDSAAACSTLITELHNPHINKTMVSAANLHIASPSKGIQHVADYVKKLLD